MGGAYPLYYEPLPDCRPEEQRLAIVSFQEDCHNETHGDLLRPTEGNRTATPLRLSIFSGLSWENSILDVRVLFTWLLVYMGTCFFPEIVLRRN